jgi:hypothetical protein
MKVTVQVVVQADDDTGAPSVVREVLSVDRDALAPDTLGLQRGEAMDLLSAVQGALVDEQAKAALATQVACPECGRPRRHKDSRTIVVRSLFGTLRLASPRWWHCDCQPQASRTFTPAGCGTPDSGHAGASVPGSQVRRAGLLRADRSAAGEGPAPGSCLARHRCAPPRLCRGPTPGRRARGGAVLLHRGLPAGLGRAATTGPAADRRPGRRLVSTPARRPPAATDGSR